jgi:hypothetical protein
MGHIRLGTLLKTQKWQEVVDLIAGEADVARIAAVRLPSATRFLHRDGNRPPFHKIRSTVDLTRKKW